MQLLNKNQTDGILMKVLEKVQDTLKNTSGADQTLALNVIGKTELNSFAGVLFAAKEINGGVAVVKPIVVPTGLENVIRTFNENGNNGGNKTEVPALPKDLVNSPAYRKAVRDLIAKRLNKATEKLILLPLVSTPVGVDVTSDDATKELFFTLYNEIAAAISNSSDKSAKLSFVRDSEGNGQKLVITADFSGADVVDEFGNDVRSDIMVSIGAPTKTNDDIGTTAEAQWGKLASYMDFLYAPRTIPSNQYGVPDIVVPYAPRLNIRMFEGPDGHTTLEHDLFAVAALRAIYGEANLVAMATYPNYALPANAIDLRNIGALAADHPCSVDEKGNPVYEYIPLFAKKDVKLHKAICQKLLQRSLRVSISLRPYQIRGATHLTLFQAAIGNEQSVKQVVNAAVTLTGGTKSTFKPEGYINGNKQIFEKGSIHVGFCGTFLNPISKQWEDLARLDGVAVFNLLCNDPKAGGEFQALAREYADFMLPCGNDIKRISAMWHAMAKVLGSAKNVRIADYEYRPMFTKVFLDELSNALNAQTSLSPRVIAPNVEVEQQRGSTTYSFNDSGDFSQGGGAWGTGQGGTGFSTDFSGYGNSW